MWPPSHSGLLNSRQLTQTQLKMDSSKKLCFINWTLWSRVYWIYSSCHYCAGKWNSFNTFHDVCQHLCDHRILQLHIKKTHMPVNFYLVTIRNVLATNHVLVFASIYELSAPNKVSTVLQMLPYISAHVTTHCVFMPLFTSWQQLVEAGLPGPQLFFLLFESFTCCVSALSALVLVTGEGLPCFGEDPL